MSHAIKNVALAGASGNVGARVLDALLDLKFNVTVLSRNSKSFPTGACVKVVDFTSVEDLSAAIAGQDAVIDTTFSPEVDTPSDLLKQLLGLEFIACFITSDFGLDPDLPGVHDIPVFSRKKVSYEAVKKQAADNRLTYTLVACGAFLDWGLSTGFAGLNFQEKTAWIFGDGSNVVPWTTLEDVGKATANVLLHPQETLNRPVYVHSVFMSQNQLFDAAKEALGNKGGRPHIMTWNLFSKTLLPGYQSAGTPWARDDNALVGLEEWSQEKVKVLIRTVANKAM
ncbi:hypothetical protein N7453_009968 [Penicillium expansum]|nr:hypothetical protein N7453_009968 [Penicillium expansum]